MRDDAARHVGRDFFEEDFHRFECPNLDGFATYDVRSSSAFVVRLVDDEDGVAHGTATGREHPQQANKVENASMPNRGPGSSAKNDRGAIARQ